MKRKKNSYKQMSKNYTNEVLVSVRDEGWVKLFFSCFF